jgi:hypothetical protein
MTTTTPNQTKHIIDLDAPLFIPEGWEVHPKDQPSNVVRGMFEWYPAKVRLHLTPNQQRDNYIEDDKFRQELENELLFNANLLDYLLTHPEIILEEWKQDEQGRIRYIFFWGTIYYSSYSDDLLVCGLYWDGDRWDCDFNRINYAWAVCNSAAVLAS